MYMANGNAYVPMAEFRKLQKQVEHMVELHEADEGLSKEEKELLDKARKDLRKNKASFSLVDDL